MLPKLRISAQEIWKFPTRIWRHSDQLKVPVLFSAVVTTALLSITSLWEVFKQTAQESSGHL